MSIRDFLGWLDGHPLVTSWPLPPRLCFPCSGAFFTSQDGRPQSLEAGLFGPGLPGLRPGHARRRASGLLPFFTRENLLDASVLSHFLPLVSMAATLLIIRRKVDFRDLPGFGACRASCSSLP
jgi:hypothetical protein